MVGQPPSELLGPARRAVNPHRFPGTMPIADQLSERELRVLEAVVQTYIETAEPTGSQTIARKFGLGVSPATIRSTMSELEDKGYLFHTHTSAGRIPTDRAYRVYVDAIMRLSPPSHEQQDTLRAELVGNRSAVEEILRRAAQVLGVDSRIIASTY